MKNQSMMWLWQFKNNQLKEQNMQRVLVCLLILLGSNLYGQDPKTDEPVVKVETKVTITVPKGVLGEGKQKSPYVFDSSTKNYLIANLPEGASLKSLVWINDDGPPDIEPIGVNTADNPSLIQGFSQASPGLYLSEVYCDKGFAKVWLLIKGSGPAPPVDPTVPPVVVVPPGPVVPTPPVVDPSVSSGFRAMFVYESTNKLTKDQSNIMTSVRIRKYLDKVCTKGTDGQYKGLPEYRFWDKDGKDAAKDSATIKKFWTDLKPSIDTVQMPFMAIRANGKDVVVPLREGATVDSVLTKLVELGGPE
jgi:hypothetical protein